MTRTEKRVVEAFIACVTNGEIGKSYAVLILEDAGKYGWLSAEAKAAVYAAIEGSGGDEEVPDPEAGPAPDSDTAERLADLEEALDLILSGVTE